MSFDWSEYLDLIFDLMDSPKSGLEEALYRLSVSRAYYSVFCLSRDYAGLKNYKPQKASDPPSHKKVIDTYKNSIISKDKQIGLKLDELKRLRILADYNGDKTIQINHAERATIIASEVLQLLWV